MSARHSHFLYSLTFTELEYTTIMQLVMRYGTGVDQESISTDVDLRKKLARPRVEQLFRLGTNHD